MRCRSDVCGIDQDGGSKQALNQVGGLLHGPSAAFIGVSVFQEVDHRRRLPLLEECDDVDHVEEVLNLEELLTKSQASQTLFLDQLHNSFTIPSEGLLKLATRFDECALPLLRAHLATERDFCLVLHTHIPVLLRKETYYIMNVKDKKRRAKGIECSNRQEVIEIATGVERNIVAFEAKMRYANQPPPSRPTNSCLYMFENERVV